MINTVIAVCTLVCTMIVSLSALRIARSFQKRAPEWIDGFLEDKLNTFMAVDPETNMNFVDMLAQRFGKGFRMSLLAQKSGESRHQKMIEDRVFNAALENIPELKMGVKMAEKFGLGDLVNAQDAPMLLQLAQKYGLTQGFFNRNIAKPSSSAKGSVFEVV